jgi:hypothetical protein
MSNQFKGYAVRCGDLWWSQRYYNFVDKPDETSFTPTLAGATIQRINRFTKMFTDNVEILTAQYTPEYFTQRRSLTYLEAMEQIAAERARLVQWQNARVVETTLNVTEV